MGVTLVALVLAIAVPTVRYARRVETHADSVAASADGSTFAALMGDGRVLFWDKKGSPKGSLQTQGSFGAELAISFDGKLLSLSPNEILEVNARSVWRSLPRCISAIAFSSVDERLAAVNDLSAGFFGGQEPTEWWFPTGKQPFRTSDHHVYVIDQDGSRRMICGGDAANFSPDGKRLAVYGGIHIFDAASGRYERSMAFIRGEPAKRCECLAWAPDSDSLAAVFLSYGWDNNTPEVSIETYNLAGRCLRSVPVPREDWAPDGRYRLAYLPEGQRLLVRVATRSFKVLDAVDLQPVTAADMSKLWHVAAGLQGDAFVAAESHAVDLWDAATLRPRRRLFEATPRPDHRLPTCGLAIWLVVFAVRHRGRIGRSKEPAARLYSAPVGAQA
jgi:WD40 repeat protein